MYGQEFKALNGIEILFETLKFHEGKYNACLFCNLLESGFNMLLRTGSKEIREHGINGRMLDKRGVMEWNG